MASTDPWDGRLARWLVRPLRDTPVHPNHVTTAALATGLVAAALFAAGSERTVTAGGLAFVLSSLLDHADGELARMAGKTSDFGRAYDRVADLVVKLAVFAGMGIGASGGRLGRWPALMGLVAGTALVAIFSMRSEMLRRRGPSMLTQPSAGGFEIEDVLYVIAPVAWAGWIGPFVMAAGVGAPLFALRVTRQWLRDRVRLLDNPETSH